MRHTRVNFRFEIDCDLDLNVNDDNYELINKVKLSISANAVVNA